MSEKQLDIVTMQNEKVKNPKMHLCLLVFSSEDGRVEYVEWPLPVYRVTGIDSRFSNFQELERDDSGREILDVYPSLENTKTYKEIIDRFFTPKNSAGNRLRLCEIPSVELIDVFMSSKGRILKIHSRKMQYIQPGPRGGWLPFTLDVAAELI